MGFSGFPDSAGTELLRLLPPVLRARDFHLYLDGGRRLTDLWQLGGMAILGHKPSRILGELKSVAERGLFAPLPHPAENRFLKALAQLFPSQVGKPQFCFRLYNDNASLAAALKRVNLSSDVISDPAMNCTLPPTGNGEIRISLWRPFMEKSPSPLFIPVLPWAFSPKVLVFEKNLEDRFPPGGLLSPLILTPAARGIYNLLAAGKDGGRPHYPRLKKALSQRGGKWRRRGIYLRRCSDNNTGDWKQLWEHFLENGFLLPPNPQEPLILPGTLSSGEEAKLAGLLDE